MSYYGLEVAADEANLSDNARIGMRKRLAAIGRCGGLAAAVAVISTLGLAGCSGPKRTELTEAQLQARAAADMQEMGKSFHASVGKLISRIEAKGAEPGSEPTLNVLAISGGGDYGAFGAGFLVGWGTVADGPMHRPEFDAVTGVSTGALIAPFAFIGTEQAYQRVEEFYRNPKKDWLKERGLLFFLPSNPSFVTIPGLERDIRNEVNEQFVAKLAEESRKGKILAIGTTDLDLGRQRFWEVGAIAEAALAEGDPSRVERILLASSAVPAAFPPIEIGDSVYGDGCVTANVFLRLDDKNPSSLIPRWKAAHPDKPLPKVRYWIIINNQLNHIPKTVQLEWPAIIGPALETAVRFATLAEVRWLSAEAEYVNAVYGTDIEVRVVGVPNDWRPPVEGSFKEETMRSLADLGRKHGADPKSWNLMVTPKSKAPRTEATSAEGQIHAQAGSN